MRRQSLHHRALAFAAAAVMLVFSGWAMADPPSRVARLGYAAGAVSFSPAGEDDWVRPTINRPLTTGDRLWSAADARAEIQVGGAMIRMSDRTSVSILNLDDRIAQLQLTQGSLNVRVRRLERDQAFEVDTPNLAFILRQPGEYRIDVDSDGNATTIAVRNGQGEVYGEGASYVIDSRQPYRFTGTGLREYELVDTQRPDDFDRWAGDRDRAYDQSGSARYVSQDVVGYQDLDANGTWRVDATYGNVWMPNRVGADWVPYRDGHWAWVDPWGWTWIDDAPWGFAVSHYGRWANLGGTWGWVPGPMSTRAYYAPALVVFVGGANFQLTISSGNVGGIAWFPLGPREVYRPSYPVSRGYFENVNQSNTVINSTVINNYYNNTNVTNVVYANRRVPGAVVAVPTTAFMQSQPVSRVAVRVPAATTATAPVAAAPPVAPTDRSVRGAAAQADKPPARVFERPVVARTAPPAAHAGFAAQQPQLTAKPGQPLDDAARKQLKPAATAPVPVVKVIPPSQEAPRSLRALPVAPAAKPVAAPSRVTPAVPQPQASQQREPPGQRAKEEARGQSVAPPAPTREVAQPKAATPPQVAAPARPGQQQSQRTQSEPSAIPQAEQPAAPIKPGAAPSRVTPAVPQPQASQQREPPGQRAKEEARGQSVAPPPAPTREVAQPKAATPPQVAAPARPGQQQPQRTQSEPAAASQAEQPAAPPRATPPVPQAKAPQRRDEARGQPVASPPAPVREITQPAVTAPAGPQRERQAKPEPATKAGPPLPQSKPAASAPNETKKDADEQTPDEEARKQRDRK